MNAVQQQQAGAYENGISGEANGRLANGLGWFSIGLGLAEVVTPGTVANLIGVQDDDKNRSLLRFYGMRELAAGVGILSQPQAPGWVWSRVAGDLMDLATLARAMRSDRSDKTRVAAATAAVLGVTALDVVCAQRMSDESAARRSEEEYTVVVETITVNRSPEEVYAFWRNFEELPKFMRYIDSVQITGDRRSHWRAKGPGGTAVEWDAEITDDRPNEMISWRSLENSDVYNAGTVRFQRATGGRGTSIRVDIRYAPPGGSISAAIAKLFAQDPGQQIHHDLRALKQILETGEVVKSDASIHSGMHPAQPPTEATTEQREQS